MIRKPFQRIQGESISFTVEFPETVTEPKAHFFYSDEQSFESVDMTLVSGNVWIISLTEQQTENATNDEYHLELEYKVGGKVQKFQVLKFMTIKPTWQK